MNKNYVIKLYDKYYSGDKARQGLFTALTKHYSSSRVLYPGSFIHINASYEFSDVTYVDNDKQAKKFFANRDDVIQLVNKYKTYQEQPIITFKGRSYESDIGEKPASFDMLISLYAGFISQPCKRYLKKGGLLAVNNSHGDAGLADLDCEFKLVGVMTGQSNRYKISENRLEEYFQPKKNIVVTEQLLRSTGRGVGYKLTASMYIFQKI